MGIWVVAGLLLANLVVLLSRNGGFPDVLPAAWAQRAPIAGGSGVFVMPAQMSPSTWGCYLLDVDAGSLCVYQYFPGNRQLQFVAARNYRYDRRLGNYNTTPAPDEIRDLVEKEQKAGRGGAATTEPSVAP